MLEVSGAEVDNLSVELILHLQVTTHHIKSLIYEVMGPHIYE